MRLKDFLINNVIILNINQNTILNNLLFLVDVLYIPIIATLKKINVYLMVNIFIYLENKKIGNVMDIL